MYFRSWLFGEHTQLISFYFPHTDLSLLFVRELHAGKAAPTHKELIQTPWTVDEIRGLLI